MMPASTRGIGMALGFPDVCNTPVGPATAPIPYPNIADHTSATNTVTNVRVNMMDSLNQLSSMSMTSGDEAGSAHPTIKGSQQYTMGMPNIRLNMMPAITLASLTNHNRFNCPIGAVLVPSAPNVRINLSELEGPHPRTNGRAGTPLSGELADADVIDVGDVARGDGVREQGDVIEIRSFGMAAAAEIAQAVHRALERGTSAITLDLRGCRGGVLTSAVDAAGLFLGEGTPIVTIVDEDGDRETTFSRGGPYEAVPLELVVDGGTASAAEVFVAALFCSGRASLAGTRTRGKGTIAKTVSLGDGRVVAVPAGVTLTPDGEPIDGRGIAPGFYCASPPGCGARRVPLLRSSRGAP